MSTDSEEREDGSDETVLGNGESLSERIERLEADSEDLDEKDTVTTDDLRATLDLQ